VFRDVIFDLNGQYHVAVPLNIPRSADNYAELHREAHRLANLCYALEGKGILSRPMSFLPGLVVQRQLKRRGSKFVACYGNRRPARFKRGWEAVRSVWSETAPLEKPAFKVYRFKKGAWPEMILGAVMGGARIAEPRKARGASDYSPGANGFARPNGHHSAPAAIHLPQGAWNGAETNGHHDEGSPYGRYQHRHSEPAFQANGAESYAAANGHGPDDQDNGFASHEALEPAAQHGALSPDVVPEDALYAHVPPRSAAGSPVLGPLQRAWARLLPRRHEARVPRRLEPGIDPERIANRFARSRGSA